MPVKHSSHEYRYVAASSGIDVYAKRNYPGQTITFKDSADRDLVLENLQTPVVKEILEGMSEANFDAAIDFKSTAAEAFTEIDAFITALVAIRNAKATEQSLGTTGTYGVA